MAAITTQVVTKDFKLRVPAAAQGIAVEPQRIENVDLAALAGHTQISFVLDECR